MTTTSSTSAWARLSEAAGRRPVLTAAVVLVALICLAFVTAYVAMQTEPGRAWLARTLERSLSQPGSRDIAIGRIQGHLPAEILIDELTIADGRGVWLTARGLTVDWSPIALLRGRLEIRSATAHEVSVARRPATHAPAPEGGLPRLPPLAITVERLAIDSLLLEEPLLGIAASLKAAAEVNVSTDAVHARFDLRRTDSVVGHANAVLTYDPALESLDLNAELSEPPGGVMARLLKLPRLPAIELALSGEGPAADWRGTIDFNADRVVSLESGLTVSIRGPEIRVALEGVARPGDAVGTAETVFGPQTVFAASLTRPVSDNLVVTIDRLESEALEASGSAELDLSDGTITGNVRIATRDAKRITPSVAPANLGAGRVEGRLSGPLSHPAIELDAAIDSPEIAGWSARSIDVHAVLSPGGPIGGPKPVRMEARATLAGFHSPVRELNAALGDRVQVTVAQAALGGLSRLAVGEATVAGIATRATAAGDIVFETGGISAHGQLEIDDLSPLSERVGRTLRGRLISRYDVSHRPADALSIGLDGTIHDGRLGNAIADALLGPQAAFTGRITRSAVGQWSVTDASIRGAGTSATGQLSIPPGGAPIAAEYGIEITNLAALNLADPARPDRKMEIRGTASGPLDSPALAGTATMTAARPAGFVLDRLTARYILPGLAGPVKGQVELEGAAPLLPDLSGRMDFALVDQTVELTPLRLAARGTVVSGNIAVPFAGPPLRGTLTIAAADLATWSPVAQQKLAGRMKAQVTLSADQGRQQIVLKASASAFALDDAVASQDLSATARVSDVFGSRALTISLTSGAGRIGPLKISSLSGDYSGTETNADFNLRVGGEYRGPLRLEANGTVRREPRRTVLTVARLAGEVMGAPVALRKPAVAGFGPGLESATLGVDVAAGSVDASLRRTPADVSLEATARSLPMALFWADAPPQFEKARIDATATLNGPVAGPEGRFDLSLSDLAPGEIDSAPDGLALNVEARLRNGTLAAIGRFKGLGAASAEIDAKIPVRLSLSPPSAGIDDTAPVSGLVRYSGPIRPLAAVAELDRHRLEGETDIRLQLAGTLRNPRIEGTVRLTGGRYENLDTGTILTDITLLARPVNNAIVIDEATAGDGDGGHIVVTGDIGLGGEKGMTAALDARFDKARLVRRDEVTVVSSGSISLRGDASVRTVAGRLVVDEAEIRLIAGVRPDVVQIEVEETGTPPAGTPSPPQAPKSSRTLLDISVSIPKRMFVRGRGLDSEWGGELHVAGTAASPRLQGSLRPLRGRYDFLGKAFTLKEGSIDFTGAERIDPNLDLSAERAVTGMTAIIRVSGTARKPVVRLDSVPQFPQDEVISQVLFNKSTGRLSPVEAVQLGQAAASMTGATNGGGIIDFSRRMLNLDVLEFKSAETPADGEETGQTSVEAGKYLTDDVYIGVAGGAAGAAGATVEIEVTPRVRIEGDVGQKEKESIGLKWKRDY